MPNSYIKYMVEVVAAIIWNDDRFFICQRPYNKARGGLWEFPGGKVEKSESAVNALKRECFEELGITISVEDSDYYTDNVYEYPDITIHLSVYNVRNYKGTISLNEHNSSKWILPAEIYNFEFCPADTSINCKIVSDNIKIRKGTINDLESILDVYKFARNKMKTSGNPNQWGNTYPTCEIVQNDLITGINYVITLNDKICSTFVFFDTGEEDYNYIEGEWLNDEKYGTIHRVGSNDIIKGNLKYIVNYCWDKINNLKIDTHRDNVVMQHLLLKYGFNKCGIIYLKNGNERIAFQKGTNR